MRNINRTIATGKPYAGGRYIPKKFWVRRHKAWARGISIAFRNKKTGKRSRVW